MGEIIGILAVVVVAPLALILHYVTEWKKQRGLSSEDEKMLDEVYEMMDRMEDRLRSLERILDDEDKSWRRDEGEPAEGSPRRGRTYPKEVS